jgi:hypothetical protein
LSSDSGAEAINAPLSFRREQTRLSATGAYCSMPVMLGIFYGTLGNFTKVG